MQEKAYKLLALQENISKRQAKDLIDRGWVFSHGKKILMARSLMDNKTKFNIMKIPKPKIIFEDDKIIAVNKPHTYLSEEIQSRTKASLLNRLDRDTSGVILLCKDENFRKLCIEEFRKGRVYKSYIAILNGILPQRVEINQPILSIKTKNGALSRVCDKGLNASSIFIPIMIEAKKTLAKIIIKTGRTHQIRVHAQFIKHAIIGDEKYGKIFSDRMYLHSYKIEFFNYSFKADLDASFMNFGFKNLYF